MPEDFKITSMDQKVQCRNGQPARLLAVDVKGSGWSVVAAVEMEGDDEGAETVLLYSRSGRLTASAPNEFDLVPVPGPKVYKWLNVYRSAVSGAERSSCPYGSRAAADAGAANNRVGCIRVELRAEFDEDPEAGGTDG